MKLRPNSVGVAGVLQRYQQILRGYSTTRAEEKFKSPDGHNSASASAYEVLGLPETCNATSIRMAFRKLAKATHPDLQSQASTVEFIRVLAAYEILSDPQKRAQYDENLRFKRAQQSRSDTSEFREASYESGFGNGRSYEYGLEDRSTEVVSWLKSYRSMVKDIIRRQEIGVGSGWEEDLRAETKSALKKAYFGPPVSDREGLPECFEAEERAQPDLQEVLHLVSGRQLFGLVRLVQVSLLDRGTYAAPSLPQTRNDEVDSSSQTNDQTQVFTEMKFHTDAAQAPEYTREDIESTFVDLELQMFGNVVARSIRVPATESCPDPSVSGGYEGKDCIYVYLSSEQVEEDGTLADGTNLSVKRIFLGSIRGLGSSEVGSVCNVYGPDGKNTHLILQHRTPMVKHMQWFRIGEDGSPYTGSLSQERTRTTLAVGTLKHSVKINEALGEDPRTEGHTNRTIITMGGQTLLLTLKVARSAYKTLDEEAAQRRKVSISTQLKTWFGLEKFSSSISVWWRRRWSSSMKP
ncbi:hypothetical protein AXG93_1660s1190 [Marchantia polymorpha subsp. ruderalis]|uniref:J domain-containing protein n=1 Tax=Marchantia polymorpha subsp. ruderalis TaxID=1480154 RepID=A0A176VSN5_MARPO|nr:hypothetical protein AXG93_1660s1190 [Marchantia polymorpha subsp. ruderalis]